MEPITIILIIVGVLLLVGSCFLTEKDGELSGNNYEELVQRLAKRELTPEEVERLRQTVDGIVSEKREEVITKTDDYLSKVANEKIMSVDEFSKQILERLDKNNADVMFLYNMVTETKEELKSEIANAKKAEEALRDASRQCEENAKKIGSGNKAVTAEERNENLSGAKREAKPAQAKKKAEKTVRSSEKVSAKEAVVVDDISELLAATVREIEEDISQDLPKERILQLHKKGKSIREISRELGMGQGEVKLVIDLYGA